MTLPSLPSSWSALTWQQLCTVWAVKQRYGGQSDVARVAAMLSLLECRVCRGIPPAIHTETGETLYRLCDRDGCFWTVTAREAAYLAKRAIPWFDFPYGDPGEKEERDEKNNITKEGRDPVPGYVSPMRDALMLPEEKVTVGGGKARGAESSRGRRLPSFFRTRSFALPQVACNNLTWQQYRSLQAVAPQLFADGITDEQALDLQAQFLAHALVPRSLALLDTSGGSIRIRPHWEYRYNSEQAEGLAKWFGKRMRKEARRLEKKAGGKQLPALDSQLSTLFHVCFQAYQTALSYYAAAYPLLFSGSDKGDKMRDALQGEVGTINTIMKYAGYAEQQQVYDSNLPFVLDILNTMTKEAKEIEKMNSKIKKK